MDQRFRRGFTTAEKTELWDRWQRGESLKGTSNNDDFVVGSTAVAARRSFSLLI
jgi:hypothetical protein